MAATKKKQQETTTPRWRRGSTVWWTRFQDQSLRQRYHRRGPLPSMASGSSSPTRPFHLHAPDSYKKNGETKYKHAI